MNKYIGEVYILMKRLIGFILFWMAVGMLLVYLLPNLFIEVVVIAILLILGYHLFCW